MPRSVPSTGYGWNDFQEDRALLRSSGGRIMKSISKQAQLDRVSVASLRNTQEVCEQWIT